MKLTLIKIATVLTLTAITTFTNANNNDELIYSDDSLFSNQVAQKITEHQQVSAQTIADLAKKPTRKALQANLGHTTHIRNTDETETWFYGVELTKSQTENEKCLVAFIFDSIDDVTPHEADTVSFSKNECENMVAQQHHNH